MNNTLKLITVALVRWDSASVSSKVKFSLLTESKCVAIPTL